MILGGDGGTTEAGSCSVPLPPFPGTHVCFRRHRHRHAHAFSWFLRRSQHSCMSQTEPRQQQGLSACLAVHDGERGEGECPRSTPAACVPWSSQRCAYAPVRGRMGSKCHNSGERQPRLRCALLTVWLLGRPFSLSPPMTPLLRTETSTRLSSDTVGATVVSHCFTH